VSFGSAHQIKNWAPDLNVQFYVETTDRHGVGRCVQPRSSGRGRTGEQGML